MTTIIERLGAPDDLLYYVMPLIASEIPLT
jgi:hypothetical protein